MSLFPCLPKIERCCFCTRNLKWAAILVIFLGMLSSIYRLALLTKPYCKTLYNDSQVSATLHGFMYILFVLEIILLACGFALLLSIFFWPKAIAADIYICCALATAVISIIFAIIKLVQGYYVNCGFQWEVINYCLHFGIWIYFASVINTYRDIMAGNAE